MTNQSTVRGTGRFLRNSLAAAIGVLTLAVAGGPAAAADDPGYKLRQARLCDTSGCYLAWRVVDSDQDGVADVQNPVPATAPVQSQTQAGPHHVGVAGAAKLRTG